MPTMPTVDQVDRQLPSGNTSIIRADTTQLAQSQGRAAAIRGSTAATIAQAGGALADRVSQLAYDERQRLNRLKITEAENAMLDMETDLSIGERGYQKVKQGDVLKPEYLKGYSSEFDTRTKSIADGLASDEQRAMFKEVADKRRSVYLRGVMTHAMDQAEQYEDTVYKGQLASHANYALARPTNQDAVLAGVEGTRAAVLNRLAQKGITDPTTVEAAVLDAVGGVHAGILDAAIDQGSVQYANQYFEAKRGEMTAEQVSAIEGKLRTATSFALGDDVGNQAFALKQQGASNVDIQKFINESTGGDAAARRAAQSAMLELEQAEQKDIQETGGNVLLGFLTGGGDAAAMNSALRSRDFLALPADRQVAVWEHMMGSIDRSERSKENDPKSRSLLAQYAENKDELARLSDAQIANLSVELGNSNADKLRSWRNEALKAGAGAKFDAKLVDEALVDIKRKEDKIRAKGFMESELMDWRVAHPGTAPTEEEQRAMIRSGLETYTNPGTIWDTDEPLFKAEVGKGYLATIKQRYPLMEDEKLVEKTNQFLAFSKVVPMPGLDTERKVVKYEQYGMFRDTVLRLSVERGLQQPSEVDILREWARREGRPIPQ